MSEKVYTMTAYMWLLGLLTCKELIQEKPFRVLPYSMTLAPEIVWTVKTGAWRVDWQ
jgi:hypothetical protein